MTDNVTKSMGSMGLASNDYEIIEAYDNNNNVKNSSNDFEVIDDFGTDNNQILNNAFKGAKLEGSKLDEAMKNNLQKNISAHKAAAGSTIGRFFMGVIHTLKKIFTFSSDNSVKTQERKMRDQTFNTSFQLPQLPKGKTRVSIGTDFIEKAIGLKTGDAKTKPWPKNIYPKGEPCLSDIKQNPELQDCWFLSSVSATLKAFGPDYIKSLIQPDQNGEGYNVRISDDIIHVPSKITSKSGKVCFSNSKPWVQILETAMQISLTKKYKEFVSKNNTQNTLDNILGFGQLPNMAFKHALIGMKALLGDKLSSFEDPINNSLEQFSDDGEKIPAQFNKAYQNKHVMVLGSKGLAASFRDGISPHHAVAVVDYNARSQKVTVLDPYGHTRVLSMNSVKKNYNLLTLGPKIPK